MYREAFSGSTPRLALEDGVVRVQTPMGERARAVSVARVQCAKRVLSRLLEDNRDHRGGRCGVLGEHEVDALEHLSSVLPV